jgi:FlaA1/EpsC-like NDP-sugar epimerase
LTKKYAKLVLQAGIDCLLFNFAYFFAYMLRFDFDVQDKGFVVYFGSYLTYFWLYTVIKLIIFALLRVYSTLWRYANHKDLLKLVGICFVSNLVCLAVATILRIAPSVPRTVIITVFIIDCVLIGGAKLSHRYIAKIKNSDDSFKVDSGNGQLSFTAKQRRILIVGAGSAAALLMRDMESDMSLKIAVLVDDDKNKLGSRISGVRIAGTAEDIPKLANTHKIDEIVIAIPTASSSQIKRILSFTKDLPIKTRILPSLKDLAAGRVNVKALRDVDLNDLLGREEVNLNSEAVLDYLKGRSVMVTGGGGSIGSEICRQICQVEPAHLILLDIYENTTFEIENELKKDFPNLKITVIIASIRDEILMRKAFEMHRPDVVFHAAAHKHVPLMEGNAAEAIVNNVLGTYMLINLCDEFSIKKMVMISTDKAVNPKNVMGATKRIAELLIYNKNLSSNTKFVAVRFGNVLGSNGSVIPIFKKQIEAGGPITITDAKITRYFMTIPEASSLVIQAGALAEGGEIYILDMGEPVLIMDLALNMIRLSGKQPYEDVDIKEIGLRPGEKLFEELSYNAENTSKTEIEKIFVAKAVAGSPKIAELVKELDNQTSFEKKISQMSVEEINGWLENIIK